MSEQTCLTLQEDCYTKSQYYTWLKLQKECINLKKNKVQPLQRLSDQNNYCNVENYK